jgi:2-polyprenyl-6-methoxyphenol hydroxylase-like FAD-dependent oxidoreductase
MVEVDVVVAGASPTGLLTATELALTGVRPVVLEALTERNPLARAGVILPRTVELLDQHGLLDPLLATGDFPGTATGHFAGLPLTLHAWPTRQSAYSVPQARIKAFLEAYLADQGMPVLRGHRVTDMKVGADHLVVTADAPDGTVEYRGAS